MSSKIKPDIQKVRELIKTAPPADDHADARTDLEHEKLELERKSAELKDLRNNIYARKLYTLLTFLLLVAWLGAIIWIIIAAGSGWYKISDAVLITLITTTTVNVASFFLAVTMYLFPSSKKDIPREKS